MPLLNQDDAASSEFPHHRKKRFAEGLLPYTTVMLVLAVLYVAWTFYSRNERAKESAAAIEKKKRDDQKKEADMIFGSGEVKFLTFGAGNGHLRRGETTRLCYGVVNAKTLKIEPAIGETVKPTSLHCADISPKTTTTYTITGVNVKGQRNSASLTVYVD